MSDKLHRWIYAVEALLIGLPTVGISIPLLILVSFFVVGGLPEGMAWLALLWVICGWLGLVAWVVITGHYLLRGRAGFEELDPFWWWGLGAGILAAGVVTAGVFTGSPLLFWFAGPALIVPALHLIAIRAFSARRSVAAEPTGHRI